MNTVDARQFVGTVNREGAEPSVRVALFVEGLEVDHVDAAFADIDTTAGFRFPVREMWRYCGLHDRVTVRVADGLLPMPDGSRHHSPSNAGTLPLTALKARLDAGEIVNSLGGISQPKYLDVAWQASVTGLHQQIHDAVREITGYESFLVYGSLLGAVREGRPLGHDCDFDTAYLSAFTDPADVLAEAGKVALALQERGFAVEARVTCLHVSDAARTQRIDLYHTYFNDDGELRLAWGSVSDVPFRREQWHGTEQIEFAGADVLIPRNADELVATLYGDDWRTPNPGFDWATQRTTRASEAYFPAALRPIINWQDYWQRRRFDTPGTFAKAVLDVVPEGARILDLGCGDGRDDALFARDGHRVIGIDRAPAAIESARRRRLDPNWVSFELGDLGEPGTLDALGKPGVNEATVFYARQLLDSLTEGEQSALLGRLGAAISPGDTAAFEFTAVGDDTFSQHELYSCGRRYVDPAPIREWASAAGLETVIDEQSTLWERRGAKRVLLHRLVVRAPA